MLTKGVRLGLALLACWALSGVAGAATLLTQSFTSNSAAGWTISGNSFLTAPSLDANGSGWLRLTPNVVGQSGAAICSTAIPSSNGVQVSFTFNDWGGGPTPADGICLAIIDASHPPSVPGAGGGSMGYAQATNAASGMVGGMLGIAFDEWGNFSTTWGGHSGGSASGNPFTVSIRGPGNGSNTLCTAPSGALNFPNYNLLFTSATLSINTLVPQPNAVTRPTASGYLRQALVNFDMSGIAAGHAYVTVQIYDGGGNLLATPCNNQDVGAALIGYFGAGNVPSSFLVALTSGSGAAKNTHEVQNLTVSTAVQNLNGALLSQSFTGIAASGWNIGGNAFLTAPSLDTDGSGWLRLTPNVMNQAGYALGNTAISASNGIQVAFDFNDWGGGLPPADGICLAIIDANHPPSGPGAPGGAMGYMYGGTSNGIAGGMLGIAFDEFGNFSGGGHPFTVAMRGPGNGTSSNYITAPSGVLNFTNYNLLFTSATLSTNVLVPQPNAVTRPTSNNDIRHAVVNFDMSDIANSHAYVGVQIYDGNGTLLATPCANQDVGPQLLAYFGVGNIPASFEVALTSGTGGSKNTHDVRNLVVTQSVTMRTVTGVANPLAAGPVTGGGTYPAGSNAVLTASIGSGWLFTGWNDASTNNPYTIVVPATNITYTANYTGYFTYTTNGGAITITGWNGAGGAVTIPSTINGLPVTTIAPNAFTGNNNVTSFAVPASVTSIGTGAFTGCPNLTAINVDPGNPNYESIGGVLYSKPPTTLIKYPEGLGGNFTIPDGVTTIGDGAFADNNGLTGVTVPASVTTLGNGVFANDPNLTDVYFQGNAPSFGTGVFTGDHATVHHRPGTTGWTNPWNGMTTALQCGPAQLFFQEAGGQVASWLLDTNGNFQTARVLNSARGWELMAVGDVDGDGVSDLLFQTPSGDIACWLLSTNGTTRSVIRWGNVGAWKICACADYAGEGHAQICFQDPHGHVALWYLDTNGVFSSAEMIHTNAGAWRLRAAIPHAAGVSADLYWQTPAGLVAVWQQQPTGGWLAQVVGHTGGWVLCGAVDVDGDGCGDLLWQTADGQTAGWSMNSNNTMRAATYFGATHGWKLKGGGH